MPQSRQGSNAEVVSGTGIVVVDIVSDRGNEGYISRGCKAVKGAVKLACTVILEIREEDDSDFYDLLP